MHLSIVIRLRSFRCFFSAMSLFPGLVFEPYLEDLLQKASKKGRNCSRVSILEIKGDSDPSKIHPESATGCLTNYSLGDRPSGEGL